VIVLAVLADTIIFDGELDAPTGSMTLEGALGRPIDAIVIDEPADTLVLEEVANVAVV